MAGQWDESPNLIIESIAQLGLSPTIRSRQVCKCDWKIQSNERKIF